MKTRGLFFGLLTALLAIATLPACQKAPEEPADEPLTDVVEVAEWVQGTVVFVDLEGGFYGIQGDDGTQYDPMYLDESFHQDSLRVRFQFAEVDDAVGIRQWGRIIELEQIERID